MIKRASCSGINSHLPVGIFHYIFTKQWRQQANPWQLWDLGRGRTVISASAVPRCGACRLEGVRVTYWELTSSLCQSQLAHISLDFHKAFAKLTKVSPLYKTSDLVIRWTADYRSNLYSHSRLNAWHGGGLHLELGSKHTGSQPYSKVLYDWATLPAVGSCGCRN